MRDLVEDRRAGILTYGITPPKVSWDPARVHEVAARQSERIARLAIDAVVVYDLQDESLRNDAERPFPFERTVDPVRYAYDVLNLEVPAVTYRCVATLTAQALEQSLAEGEANGGLTVFVGAASRDQEVITSLREAYDLRRGLGSAVPLGGVLIGERHRRRRDEHRKVLAKVDAGCSFFVTQAVYSTTATKDVLSDLQVACDEEDRPVPPVVVTLTPCGSARTLTFLRWLGVEVPVWLENDLLRASDTLAESVDVCAGVFSELWSWAGARDIPLGCNVESVSLAGAEIEASVDLVTRVGAIMGR